VRLVNAHLTIKQTTMKKHFYNLLDQVTPANDEHKDILTCFLGFLPLLIITIGALYSLLIFMR